MPNSYVEYVAPGPTNNHVYYVYNANGGIDGYIDKDFIEVYVNNAKITYGSPSKFGDPYWSLFENPTTASAFVNIWNTSTIAAGSAVRIQRVTPNKLSTFKDNVLEFFNTEVLNAEQLNLALKAMIHLVQEAKEQSTLVTTGGQYLPKDTSGSPNFWTAQGLDIRNLPATPPTANSATPKAWVEATIAAAAGNPGGPPGGQVGTSGIADLAVTNPKIATEAVDTSRLADNAVTTQKILDDAVTTAKVEDGAITDAKIFDPGVGGAFTSGLNGAKIQINTLPTNRLNGFISITQIEAPANNSVLGAINGVRSNIDCTSFARTLLDDTSAGTARTTLGIGSIGTLNSISNANIDSAAGIAYSKLATTAPFTVVANNSSSTVAPSATAMTSIPLNSWGTATGNVVVNAGGGSNRITSCANPIDPQDVATKGWVESQSSSWPGVYNGSSEILTDYPIGTSLLVFGSSQSAYALNSVQSLRYQTTSNTVEVGTAAAGYIVLSGTWRARGTIYFTTSTFVAVQITLFTRTA